MLIWQEGCHFDNIFLGSAYNFTEYEKQLIRMNFMQKKLFVVFVLGVNSYLQFTLHSDYI